MKIGFFDSGLGGVNILEAVAKELPEYDYEFYGDTANLPYGDKEECEIYDLTKKGMEYLFAKDCLLIVVACNTASAETLRKLQTDFLPEKYPERKILGVIIPTVEAVLESSVKNVTLIGTKRTVESKKYELEFAKFDSGMSLDSRATPTLVPLIEDGQFNVAHSTVAKILDDETGERGVVLGCTHYSVLKDELRKRFQEQSVKIFSQDELIPGKLKSYLQAHPEIESRLSRDGNINIYLTDKQGTESDVSAEQLTKSLSLKGGDVKGGK